MDRVRPASAHLADLTAYDASLPDADTILCLNENPENLPGEVIARLVNEFPQFRFNRYPDPNATRLSERIAEANGLEPANVVIGNGGDELIFNLFLLWGGPGRTLLNMPPTFSVYEIDAKITNTNVVNVPRDERFDIDREAVLARLDEGDIDIVAVVNPNNPTGNLADESFLLELLEATDALVMVDEAYFEFSRTTMRHHMEAHKNLVILRTFSKAFSLAGLRVGYILAHEDIANEFRKVRQPYSVNAVSQWVASNVFRDRAAFENTVRTIIRGRDQLLHGLSMFNEIEVFDSQANYVLFRVANAAEMYDELLREHRILIRRFGTDPLLADCLRVTVGSHAENERFLEALAAILAARRQRDVSAAMGGDE